MTLSARVLSTIGFAALLLLAAACGNDAPALPSEPGPTTTGPTVSSPTTSQTPQAAEVLDFEAQNLAGGVLRGSDYAGEDVALWFWAPW